MEYFFENANIHKIHFVGIGGISMSALAKFCYSKNIKVSGSDYRQSQITDELKNLGITIFIGHSKENVTDADLVVYTIAVGEDNEEVVEARRQKKLVLERADFLGFLCGSFQNVIAISGTHGKTTTCGMLGSIFISAGLNPTIHIGGECKNFNGNLIIGKDKFFITEACEYKKHLLKLPHTIGVILNIEADHPDSYKSLDDLHNTFDKFALMSTKANIINEKYKVLLSSQSKTSFITFSSDKSGQFYAKNIRQYKTGKITFDCYKNDEFYTKIKLNVYGKHNVLNALACIAVADYYKISKLSIFEGLNSFSGIKRRFQFVSKLGSNLVIEDYAHHPTEIENTILTAKEIFNKKIVAVFQPHTYSRTKSLLSQFLTCFDDADKTIILPTYPAREKPIKNSSGKYLYKKLKMIGRNCTYCSSFSAAKKQLKKEKDSVILILGAGDIENLAKSIKKNI